MKVHLGPPLYPRNGHTLVVGIVARISGCQNQKELSLEDQIDHGKQVAGELYDGPVEYREIATRGKGERLDRPELDEVERMLRSRELDLLVAEDIGRMVRGTEAATLCGIAVDHGTRVIAPNDYIDTAEPTWEEDVISACRDHVGHNAHTSKRLKQKLMNRFQKFGGATARETFGYEKPEGAKTYDEWRKDEAAAPIMVELLRRARETLNCSAVADWLNDRGVPPGKYCHREAWDGAMVRRLIRNPILKGVIGRGYKHTIKHHETGRRIAVKNPAGAHFKEYLHLAYMDPADWDELNARLDEKNAGRGRKPVDGVDPRWRVPRTRTRFPGQHARCWYCGRPYVWGGNGLAGNLMCNGSREWRCWHSFGFGGAELTSRVTEAIMEELTRLEGFDDHFRGMVARAVEEGGVDLARAWAELEKDEATASQETKNLMDAIAKLGLNPMFEEKLQGLQAGQRELARRRWQLEDRRNRRPRLPGSVTEIRRLLEERFRGLAADSPEFGDVLRQVVPEIHVYAVRLFADGPLGHLKPRARVKLDLLGLVPDARHVPEAEGLLTRVLTLDLFEPPLRVRIREEAARLAAEGLDQRGIARRLSVAATQPVVGQALALDRAMRERGLRDPYQIVMGPPDDYTKLRRHKNPKYRFEPAEGYERPAL